MMNKVTLALMISFVMSLNPCAANEVDGTITNTTITDTTKTNDAKANDTATTTPLSGMNQLGQLKFHVPNTQYFEVDGVPVALTSLHDLPMVDISVVFDVGSAYDSTIKQNGYGIANMTASMLMQGTNDLPEDDFIAKKEMLAIGLSASSTHDDFSIDMRSLSDERTLADAMNLMTIALSEANFAQDVLARNKTQLTTAIKQNEQNPNYLASLAYAKALYGTHPYAYPTSGTPDSINGITRDDLIAFKTRYLVKNNAHIIITGDVTREQAEKLAAKISARLDTGKKAATLNPPQKPAATHIHIHHPSPQTVVMMGNLTQARRTDKAGVQALSDFLLGNEVLAGGDFTARLMDEIRVKKGYTYGISGNNHVQNLAGAYTISFATKNEVAKDAIKDTIAVINDTLTTGIRDDELALVKANETLSYPNRFATNSQIHHIISDLFINNYDKNHLNGRLSRIQNANLSSVNAGLKQNIHPDEFVIVTVSNSAPDLSDLTSK